MQADLINVNTWLSANRLILCIGKTSCMLVTSAQHRRRMSHAHPDLSLNDNQIEHVKASPYLGITIDWHHQFFYIQTDNICHEYNRSFVALKRAAPFPPIETRALMFNTSTTVVPYGEQPVSLICKLQKIHNHDNHGMQCHHLAMSHQDTSQTCFRT